MLQNVQPNWNENDSTSDAYIRNKPVIPTQYDWLCFTAKEANSTVRLDKVGEPPALDLEYSTDGATWYTYTWDSTTGATITLASSGDKVYWRGENDTWGNSISDVYTFVMTGSFEATGNIASLYSKTCSKTTINGANSLFKNCTALTKADIFYGLRGVCNGFDQFFRDCTGLTSVEIPYAYPTGRFSWGTMFAGCTNLSRIKVGFHSWVADKVAWVQSVAATGTFICPSDLDCSIRSAYYVPVGWKVERTSAPQADWDESDSSDPAYILNKPTIPAGQIQSDWDESDSSVLSFIANKGVATAVSVSDSTYTLNAGTTVPVITVASSLTLSADTVASGKVGYAEIVLDLAQGASVTAGSGLTLVDTPTAEKRNVCVARWQDGACKLYVVITEDLPVDESSSSN